MTTERREHRYSVTFDGGAPIEVRCAPADLRKVVKPVRPANAKVVTIVDRTACEEWVGVE